MPASGYEILLGILLNTNLVDLTADARTFQTSSDFHINALIVVSGNSALYNYNCHFFSLNPGSQAIVSIGPYSELNRDDCQGITELSEEDVRRAATQNQASA